jgi:ABC-type Fe2+-enterobactin transport system substrate-binding protein
LRTFLCQYHLRDIWNERNKLEQTLDCPAIYRRFVETTTLLVAILKRSWCNYVMQLANITNKATDKQKTLDKLRNKVNKLLKENINVTKVGIKVIIAHSSICGRQRGREI